MQIATLPKSVQNETEAIKKLLLHNKPRYASGFRKVVGDKRVRLIERMYWDYGLTKTTIAKLIGIESYTIKRWWKSLGLKETGRDSGILPERGRFSDGLGNTVITRLSGRYVRLRTYKMDSDWAYVVGLLLGDGSVSFSKKSMHYHVILYNNNLDLIKKFHSIMIKKGFEPIIREYRKGSWRAEIASAPLATAMIETNDKSIKQDLVDLISRCNLFRYFLAGFIDAEGSVSRNGIVIVNSNLKLLNSIKKELHNNFIDSRISVMTRGGRKSWSRTRNMWIITKKTAYRLNISLHGAQRIGTSLLDILAHKKKLFKLKLLLLKFDSIWAI